jgi:hypothetical protein
MSQAQRNVTAEAETLAVALPLFTRVFGNAGDASCLDGEVTPEPSEEVKRCAASGPEPAHRG